MSEKADSRSFSTSTVVSCVSLEIQFIITSAEYDLPCALVEAAAFSQESETLLRIVIV